MASPILSNNLVHSPRPRDSIYRNWPAQADASRQLDGISAFKEDDGFARAEVNRPGTLEKATMGTAELKQVPPSEGPSGSADELKETLKSSGRESVTRSTDAKKSSSVDRVMRLRSKRHFHPQGPEQKQLEELFGDQNCTEVSFFATRKTAR